MGELFRDNSRLVALMSGLFTGIIVVMGAVALFLGELDYPPLFADASSAGMAGQEPGGGEIVPAGLALPRLQEIFACFNRYRAMNL